METFFFHQDIIIITANAAGEKYLIKAKSIQDILDDWNGDCDFGTLIEYLKGLQKRESGV